MLHDLEEFRKEPNIVFDFTAEADSIDVQRLLNDPDYMPKTLGRTNAVKGALADAVAKKKQLEQDKKAQQDASRRGSRIAGHRRRHLQSRLAVIRSSCYFRTIISSPACLERRRKRLSRGSLA